MPGLTEFLEQKKKEKGRTRPDYASMKFEWIKDIEDFFKILMEWLKEPVEKELISVSEGVGEISELSLGRYQVPILILKTDWKEIYIEPVARMVLSATGRIDLYSPDGKTYILLRRKLETGDQLKNVWCLHKEQNPTGMFPIDNKLFEELLQELLS